MAFFFLLYLRNSDVIVSRWCENVFPSLFLSEQKKSHLHLLLQHNRLRCNMNSFLYQRTQLPYSRNPLWIFTFPHKDTRWLLDSSHIQTRFHALPLRWARPLTGVIHPVTLQRVNLTNWASSICYAELRLWTTVSSMKRVFFLQKQQDFFWFDTRGTKSVYSQTNCFKQAVVYVFLLDGWWTWD